MANKENAEGAAARAMAGSHRGRGNFVGDWAKTVWGTQQLNRMNKKSKSSSRSTTVSGGGGTGNGWTKEDYDNYGAYLSHHYGLHDESRQNEFNREQEGNANRARLDEAQRNAEFLREDTRRTNNVERTERLMKSATEHGGLSRVQFGHETGEHTIDFSPRNDGYGAGGQGSGAQMKPTRKRTPLTPEQRQARANGRVLESRPIDGTPHYETRNRADWERIDAAKNTPAATTPAATTPAATTPKPKKTTTKAVKPSA